MRHLSSRFRRWNSKQLHKLSPTKIATKTSEQRLTSYGRTSTRFFVGMIFFAILAYGLYLFAEVDNIDTSVQNAQYTPSETSQLRIQVLTLEREIEQLEKELARYKAKYGILPEENTE